MGSESSRERFNRYKSVHAQGGGGGGGASGSNGSTRARHSQSHDKMALLSAMVELHPTRA